MYSSGLRGLLFINPFAFSLELLLISGNYLFTYLLPVCFFFCFVYFFYFLFFLRVSVCSLACLSVAFSVVVTTFFFIEVEKG